MPTPSAIEGEVGFAVQSAKGTSPTTFYMMKLTRFTWTPDAVDDDEGEAEIGGEMDVAPAERYGYRGATFSGEGRARPGNLGFILRAFGCTPDDGQFIIYPGVNDTIRVTDAGGGPVDVNIVTGAGASAAYFTPYTATAFATHLEAALDGNTTLTATYTASQDGVDYKWDIEASGATLSLHWSHTNSNMESLLGFSDALDDTGATTYEADDPSDWAIQHVFTPIATGSSFPWIGVLDKFDQSATLDNILYDARVNRISFDEADEDVVRFSFEGRALNFKAAIGSEVETADAAGLSTPNTSKGTLYFGSENYKMGRLSTEFRWEERVIPALVQLNPEELVPGRRAASGNADIYLGAESTLWKKVYYGGASGTEPSTTIEERALNAKFQSGQAVSGLNGTTEDFYAVTIHSEESRCLTYPVDKSGDDPVMGGLTFQIDKGERGWAIALTNNYATGYYD